MISLRQISLRLMSLRSKSLRHVSLSGFVLAAALLGGAQKAEGQLLFGQLLDQATRQPISGAMVQMLNAENELLLVVQTAQDGRYQLLAPTAGRFRIVVSRIGYEEGGSDLIRLEAGQSLQANLILPPAPIAIAGVTAEVEARPWQVEQPAVLWPYFERRDFYGKLGQGRFVDREALEGWSGGIETIPEVQQMLMTMQVRGGLMVGIPCTEPAWFLDGFRLRDANINDFIGVNQIEGIEIYRRATEIPGEFGGSDSQCGVVAIWTRRR